MGQPAARITDMHTCPMVTGLVPHVGGPITLGSFTVFTGDLPQARVTDMLTCVGPPDVIVEGSTGVFVNDLPAARLGDMTAHGGVIVVGLPTVLIGETGGADDDASDSDEEESDPETEWKSLAKDFAEKLIDPFKEAGEHALLKLGKAALHGLLTGEPAAKIASQIKSSAWDAFKSGVEENFAKIATPTIASAAHDGLVKALTDFAGLAYKYGKKYHSDPENFPTAAFAREATKTLAEGVIEGTMDALIMGVFTAGGGGIPGFLVGCAATTVADAVVKKGVSWAVDSAFDKFGW